MVRQAHHEREALYVVKSGKREALYAAKSGKREAFSGSHALRNGIHIKSKIPRKKWIQVLYQ